MSDLPQGRPNCNFHKYVDSILDVVWKEVYRVFLWLYHGGEKYVGDYLETTPRGKKRLGAMEKKDLESRVKTSFFDINFLYHLLQHTCGLAEDTSHIWTQPKTPAEEKTLEHCLYLLKEQRNTLIHKPKPFMHISTEELEPLLKNLCHLCEFVIQEAGKKAKKSDEEIKDAVCNMTKNLEDIKTNPTPSEYTPAKFTIMAKQEIQELHQHPSSSNGTFVMPLIHASGKESRYEMPLKHFALWRCEDGTLPNTVILTGDTGTGKSTICRYLFDCWVQDRDDINDLQGFDLVIPVQCSSVATRDLVDFLKRFIQNTISLCGRDDTRKFLQHLRILWLIDGFEEASLDAKELLTKIQDVGTSSLIFMTTKPQFCQDVLNLLNTKDKFCEVSMSGLSIEGIGNMVEMLLEQDVSCAYKVAKFWADVYDLGDDILKELKNPLKLSIIVQLWLEGRINKESGVSLPFLYKELLSVRSKSLSELLKHKFSITESEIQTIVNKSIKTLCKVAFEMSLKNAFGSIDCRSQNYLQTGLQTPLLFLNDWLSIFLHRESHGPNGQSKYSFIHNSQQHYLAAQRVCFLMAQKRKPEKVLRNLFRPNRINSNYLYAILLQVISNLDQQEIVNEPVANILITLISKCEEFDPFDVVRHALNSPIIAKKASRFTTRDWKINDDRVQAAISLLKFVTPTHIKLYLISDPKEIKGLNELLNVISKGETYLKLLVSHHWKFGTSDSSDCYLKPFCSRGTRCILETFQGKLSVVGCELLLRMTSIKSLCLVVDSNEILYKILCNLEHLIHLEDVFVYLTGNVPVISLPNLHRPVEIKRFSVTCDSLNENYIENTAAALAQIHHQYHDICINDISADSVVRFIQTFQSTSKSKVKSFIRELDSCSTGYFINYGSIPLVGPVEDFYDQWNNTHLTEFEDELGVKRLGITTKGIPSSNMKIVEILPNMRRLQTDFSGTLSVF